MQPDALELLRRELAALRRQVAFLARQLPAGPHDALLAAIHHANGGVHFTTSEVWQRAERDEDLQLTLHRHGIRTMRSLARRLGRIAKADGPGNWRLECIKRDSRGVLFAVTTGNALRAPVSALSTS